MEPNTEIEDRLKRDIDKLQQENVGPIQSNDQLKRLLPVPDEPAKPPPLPPPRSFNAELASKRALMHELSDTRRQLLVVQDRLRVAEQVTAATQKRELEQEGVYENPPTTAAGMLLILRLRMVTSKTLYIFSHRSSGVLWRLILFYWAFFETVAIPKTVRMRSTDKDYGSLAHYGAPMLRVPLCVSRAFLVYFRSCSIFIFDPAL